MAPKLLGHRGQNRIDNGKGHGDVEQAIAPSLLRRAFLRLMGGEPGVEPILPSAHHRTVKFRWGIVAQPFKPSVAILRILRRVAKCRHAHQSHETQKGQPSAQCWRRLQSNSFETISTATPRSKFSFQNIKRLGIFKAVCLPAAVAAAGHGLEGHTDMRFAIGFSGFHSQTTEPKIICCRITDRPFAGFFGQFH